jgi:hypothetical protein
MAFVEDLSVFFADFSTTGTLAGVSVRGIFDLATVDEGPGALTQFTTFLLDPTAVVTPTVGQALVVGATTYTVRQVLMEPPDGALKRLVVTRP